MFDDSVGRLQKLFDRARGVGGGGVDVGGVRTAIGVAGGVETVLHAMRAHPTVREIQYWGAWALETLVALPANAVRVDEVGTPCSGR